MTAIVTDCKPETTRISVTGKGFKGKFYVIGRENPAQIAERIRWELTGTGSKVKQVSKTELRKKRAKQ